MHESVTQMWQSFLAANAQQTTFPDHEISTFHFCDNQTDADQCAALVLKGIKRATASSLAELQLHNIPIPRQDDLHVVTDFAGVAQCIIRTVQVDILRFADITETHAPLEGEGEGSLAHWRAAHIGYFSRVLKDTPLQIDDDLLIAFEQFEVVFPERSPEATE